MAAPAEASSATPDSAEGLALPARVLLATFSLAAGVIHLVMVPTHAQESGLDGVGFAVVGWLQIVGAIALLLKPSRRLLQVTVLVNLVVIGIWAWSRTVGLPVGGHAGIVESVSGIDLLCAVLEGLLVVGAAALLLRPALGTRLTHSTVVLASAIPVAVLIITSVVLASPSTANHVHSQGSSAVALTPAQTVAANRCDLGVNPASYWTEATTAGVDTIGVAAPAATTTPATAADGHVHSGTAAASTPATTAAPIQGSAALDKLIDISTRGGEGNDARAIVALSDAPDDAYQNWLRWLPALAALHSHATGAVDDNAGHGGHLGPQTWVAMTDPTQCAKLTSELDQARTTALQFPTAADAKAAGYVQVTGYVPGIAAHWMKFGYVDDRFEIDKPEMLLYDGNGEDAHIVGLSYYILSDSTVEPTQGFTGDNDHYHRHVGLCVKGAMVVGDSTTTAEQCDALGGRKTSGGAWMSHVWVVPGCESPWGVFSAASPLLDAKLAAGSGRDGGGCAASGVRARYDLQPGTTTNTPSTVNGGAQQVAAPR